jgi:hypothetical protein
MVSLRFSNGFPVVNWHRHTHTSIHTCINTQWAEGTHTHTQASHTENLHTHTVPCTVEHSICVCIHTHWTQTTHRHTHTHTDTLHTHRPMHSWTFHECGKLCVRQHIHKDYGKYRCWSVQVCSQGRVLQPKRLSKWQLPVFERLHNWACRVIYIHICVYILYIYINLHVNVCVCLCAFSLIYIFVCLSNYTTGHAG